MFSTRTLAATLLLAATAALGVAATNVLGEFPTVAAPPPAFCNGLNCPQFAPLQKCDGFELRRYRRAQWVGSTWEGPGFSVYEAATHDGFMKGFQYISGANAVSDKIKMTCPVLNKVVAGAGPNCNTSVTVSFFVPFKFQGKAPLPTDKATFLHDVEDMTVAVASYGGYANNFAKKVEPELTKLGDSLKKAKIPFTQGTFFAAQYDSPFRLFNRHNEVWFQVANDTRC